MLDNSDSSADHTDSSANTGMSLDEDESLSSPGAEEAEPTNHVTRSPFLLIPGSGTLALLSVVFRCHT